MDPRRPYDGSSGQMAACVVASLPVFMAGVALAWPSPVLEYVSRGRTPVQLTPRQASRMVAFIDVGNFAAAVPAGLLMDRMGRRLAVNVSAPLMFAGWTLLLFGRQVWCVYAARLVQGAAVSIAWVVTPAYVGEMASARIRGALGLLVQLSYAAGMLFSYAAGWLFDDYAALTVAAVCATVASGALLLFLPESPYYLMLTGRPDDAAECLRSLRSRCYTDDELRAELATVKDSAFGHRYYATVIVYGMRKWNVGNLLKRDRRPLAIVLVLAVLQMGCGASVLETYAASILSGAQQVSANASAAFLGLVVLLAAVPFALAVDRCGRRPLMIVSCFGAAVCHAGLAACLSAAAPDGNGGGAAGWLPLFESMAGAQFFINVGLMPLLSVVQCEYFPSDTRAMADTCVVLTVTLTSTVVVTAYQTVADAYGVAVNFVAYAALSFAGGVFCCVFVPETKCKSFAEIQAGFRPADRDRKRDYQQI